MVAAKATTRPASAKSRRSDADGHTAPNPPAGELDSQIHVVADGAEWIRLQSREIFSDQEHFLCDFYHVSEYLADASKSCRAESPGRWRKTQQKRLKNGAAAKVIQELAQHIEPPGTPEEEAPVFCAFRYMNNRRDTFDYPRALKHQLPIGSGLIESGHRHVLQHASKPPEPPGCLTTQNAWPNSASFAPTINGNPSGTDPLFSPTFNHTRRWVEHYFLFQIEQDIPL